MRRLQERARVSEEIFGSLHSNGKVVAEWRLAPSGRNPLSAKVSDRVVVASQIQILSTRALLVKQGITLATLSILFAAVLVITLFLAPVLRWEVGGFVAILFISCMGSLIVSLIAFLRDVHLSLAALKLELAAKHE